MKRAGMRFVGKLAVSNSLMALAILSVLVASRAVCAEAGEAKTQQPLDILEPDQTEKELEAYLSRHVPKFAAPTDGEKWDAEAKRLRQQVLDEVVLRGVPKRWLSGPPNVVWGEKTPAPGYTIRKLRYEAVPRLWAGALLYEPLSLTGKVPAVLNTNGHVGEPGMSIDYKQARCINLAKRRILALNLEWIGMGQLRGPGYSHYDLAYLDLCGRSGLSVFYLLLKRGLDVLCSREAADPERIAVTGLSGGGWQTIFISSLDQRVKLAAPNAGYIALPDRIKHRGDIGDLEQNPTDLVSIADYVHLTALLAPRPALLIYNDKDECCFQADRAIPSVYEPVAPVYKLLGHPERFTFHVNSDPGTHNYLKDNREAFYRFLNRNFLPKSEWIDEDLPVEDEIRTQEELSIAYPADNANFYTLAAELIKRLPRRKRPGGDGAEVDRWRQRTRRMLRRVVRPEPAPESDPEAIAHSDIDDFVDGTTGKVYRFRIADTWTLPMIECAREGTEIATTTLIIADRGFAEARELAREALARKERAIVIHVLFTGECMRGEKDGWRFAQMVATVGRRPLGIQVSQLNAIIDWARKEHPAQPLQVITKGRVAGLAALVAAALRPQCIDRLELQEMDPTLKDLLAKKVSYQQAPSMFCFGLLRVADVPELIELAGPTKVILTAAE